MKQPLQSRASSTQEPHRALHATDRPRHGWRTVEEVAVELRFTETATQPAAACRAWLKRQGIVGVKRGRRILVDGLDVDRAIRAVR